MYIIILYAILGILAYDSIVVNKVNKYWCLVAAVITLVLFWLRFNLGADTEVYMYFFERVSDPIKDSFTYLGQRNIGFNMLLYYTKQFINDYRFFVFTFNSIVLGLCGYTIFKNSHNVVMSLMLFIGSGILEIYYSSALRQMLAMAIFFYAFFRFLPNKKYKQYYCFAIIACLFHETALITLCIPIIMLLQEKISKQEKRIFSILVLLAFIFMISFSPILVYISRNFSSFAVINHIAMYFSGNTFSIMGVGLRVSLFAIIYLSYHLSDRNRSDKWLQTQVYTCFFSMLVYLALSNFSVFSRISDFVDIITLITFVNLLKNIENIKFKSFLFFAIFSVNIVTLYADIDFKLDFITGIENATFFDYRYMLIFGEEAAEYILSYHD